MICGYLSLRRFLPLLLLLSTSLRASVVVLPDFETLSNSDSLTTQYPDFTFSNAIILTAGVGLNEFECPPYSGQNVASDDGGPITIAFGTPVTGFGGYFTYLVPLTLTAFDAGDNQIALATSQFSNNLACLAGPPCSGDPGSAPNEFIEVISNVGISSITIAGDASGFSFTMDGPTAIPEPIPAYSLGLCLLCALGMKQLMRRL